MATAQAQFTDEDRAIVKEVIEAMKKTAGWDKKGVVPLPTKATLHTRGFMWNGHKDAHTNLGLYDQHNWSGAPGNPPYPKVLEWSNPNHQKFEHQGVVPNGSKAGLVYTDAEEPPARRWVVAFDAVNNKVFVDAGSIGPTDWNVVEFRLDKDGADYYEYVDPIFGGRAYATIPPG
ncbi:uncharacterized protein LOC141598517 [Silene latifolia]|uniref:uncharacterized protein LOC141598517 n=1 Tax=Silene latifolia TaxID=37657 RepID=UPI003D76B192